MMLRSTPSAAASAARWASHVAWRRRKRGTAGVALERRLPHDRAACQQCSSTGSACPDRARCPMRLAAANRNQESAAHAMNRNGGVQFTIGIHACRAFTPFNRHCGKLVLSQLASTCNPTNFSSPALHARAAAQPFHLVHFAGVGDRHCARHHVLITVLSVMNGFQREVRTRILSVASHVQITGRTTCSLTGVRLLPRCEARAGAGAHLTCRHRGCSPAQHRARAYVRA